VKEFYATVQVALDTPLQSDGDISVGYFTNIGVSAEDVQQARKLITEAIRDGQVDWRGTEWFDPTTLGEFISQFRINAKSPIIWFRSPKIFYPETDESNG
jgi:hypothetical protein